MAATVNFTIEQKTTGRKVGKSCKSKTRKNAKRKRCTLYKKKGVLRATGKAGENRKSFNGRLGKVRLQPGKYRATAVATQSGFNSVARQVSFQVIRR